jgi:hypothetical protein
MIMSYYNRKMIVIFIELRKTYGGRNKEFLWKRQIVICHLKRE